MLPRNSTPGWDHAKAIHRKKAPRKEASDAHYWDDRSRGECLKRVPDDRSDGCCYDFLQQALSAFEQQLLALWQHFSPTQHCALVQHFLPSEQQALHMA